MTPAHLSVTLAPRRPAWQKLKPSKNAGTNRCGLGTCVATRLPVPARAPTHTLTSLPLPPRVVSGDGDPYRPWSAADPLQRRHAPLEVRPRSTLPNYWSHGPWLQTGAPELFPPSLLRVLCAGGEHVVVEPGERQGRGGGRAFPFPEASRAA
jgi:hypothetical protein